MATATGRGRRAARRAGRRRRLPGVIALASALLVLGAWGVGLGDQPGLPPVPEVPAAAPVPAVVVPAAPAVPAVVHGMARSAPRRLRVPAVEVDVPLIELSLGTDGSLRPPESDRTALAGWYAAGVSPGETGTALLAGHVDTARGPAALHRLAALTPGQALLVDRADGSSARFVVDVVADHPRDAFPSDRVYAPAPRPELRVITCGGRYDRAHGGYQDNTVVYAHLEQS
ncbi:class F sortase [Kitasatospora sp. NPDC051853]|uniref:class F sortase n=1 Tax=Kitasatospora sp. NPDC051853 TaxID=3364058 RepID=UPI0037A367F2